jgi:hypothetical protein
MAAQSAFGEIPKQTLKRRLGSVASVGISEADPDTTKRVGSPASEILQRCRLSGIVEPATRVQTASAMRGAGNIMVWLRSWLPRTHSEMTDADSMLRDYFGLAARGQTGPAREAARKLRERAPDPPTSH